MFASCTLIWGLMKPHILGRPDEKQVQPIPKKTPDLGIKDKVNIFKVKLHNEQQFNSEQDRALTSCAATIP